MVKTAAVYEAVLDVLISERRSWTIAELYRALTWHSAYDLNWGEYHVRRAVAMLPPECITRNGRRLAVAARTFAPADEVREFTARLGEGFKMVLLNEDNRHAYRRALVLADSRALHDSILWAATGRGLEVEAGYYGDYLTVC